MVVRETENQFLHYFGINWFCLTIARYLDSHYLFFWSEGIVSRAVAFLTLNFGNWKHLFSLLLATSNYIFSLFGSLEPGLTVPSKSKVHIALSSELTHKLQFQIATFVLPRKF